MFNLFNTNKKEKLYKFVFDRSGGYSWEKKEQTLLVVGNSATYAVKKFYELTNSNVANITEFTEINYPKGDDSTSE